MKIKGNVFFNQKQYPLSMPFTRNEKEEKKNTTPPEIQRYLDDMKRLAEEEAHAQQVLKAEQIAKKIARGESVTLEEREQVRGIDEEMLKKADRVNFQRKQLQNKLIYATSKEEVKTILLTERLSTGTIMKDGDKQFGQFMLEAINHTEDLYYGTKRKSAPDSLFIPKNGNQTFHKIDTRR